MPIAGAVSALSAAVQSTPYDFADADDVVALQLARTPVEHGHRIDNTGDGDGRAILAVVVGQSTQDFRLESLTRWPVQGAPLTS